MATPSNSSDPKTATPPKKRRRTRGAAKPKPNAAPQTSAETPANTPADPPATPAPTPTPTLATRMEPVVAGPQLKRSELLDAVVRRSGVRKQDARAVVEAMLDTMGEAIAEGRELQLQPFGTLKVRRAKDVPNGRVMTAKIRRRTAAAPDTPD
ncbi:MAG: HU family DNA-binding protein [Pseudomonadota bacterium]